MSLYDTDTISNKYKINRYFHFSKNLPVLLKKINHTSHVTYLEQNENHPNV